MVDGVDKLIGLVTPWCGWLAVFRHSMGLLEHVANTAITTVVDDDMVDCLIWLMMIGMIDGVDELIGLITPWCGWLAASRQSMGLLEHVANTAITTVIDNDIWLIAWYGWWCYGWLLDMVDDRVDELIGLMTPRCGWLAVFRHSMGLLEHVAGTAITSVVTDHIRDYIQNTCRGDFETPYLQHLEHVSELAPPLVPRREAGGF